MLTEEILKDALHYGKAFTKLGKTAQYIPQLKEVNKYYLGVCAMDLDGMVLEAGDTRVPFTIQSISKLVSLILAIRDCGADHLFHEKVGVEPTGDPFNSIVKLRQEPGRLTRLSMQERLQWQAALRGRMRMRSLGGFWNLRESSVIMMPLN